MADDDGASSIPNSIPPHPSDSSLHKKHASVIERLANRNQTRLENSITRRSESDSSSSSTSSFLVRFSDSKRAIESDLAQCRLTPPEPSQVRSHLDGISASISDLEKLVAETSYSLPSYEVRASLKSISELKQSLEDLNSELLPKKKFSFKNKGTKKDTKSESKDLGLGNAGSMLTNKQQQASYIARDSPGIRDKDGEVLVKNFKGSDVGEFTISGLSSCEVKLIGSVRALFIHKLRNCKVYTGPVMGSILIDDVEGCTFAMASHQIRIHNAKNSDFYLRVRSRPIIEDSSSVRFAPYCVSYEGIEEDLKDASLGEETGNWENVDDFRWLRAVQSPNWSILAEGERIDTVKISSTEG
ncbi:tubulin-folding cofactor C [Cucurbita moschata]|uniref:Tubulin-folding cofactor C n=1 Tax=Cucurbita moschata TaxID=3662 RepID=A0A6J1EMN1_CUCMO|nr:tubulin-folding cofactor C [Cucurbita moschata]